ncbi:MAG: hypothetical protein WBX01_15835 [Nitrososphaeraceae archaeon]
MEAIRLNVAYDLRLKDTKLSCNTIENDEILQPIDKIYFVICNSCYWCASYFGIDDLESLSGSSTHVLDCPVCRSHNTELMPISTDESFRIEYSLTRGMEIEFYKSNNVVARHQCADRYEAQRSPSASQSNV